MEINIGLKIYEWTIISEEIKEKPNINGVIKTHYISQCSCGHKRKIRGYDLKKLSETGSAYKLNIKCGRCLNRESGLEYRIENPFVDVYKEYARRAERRNKEFTLTQEKAEELFKSNCTYCGKEPSNILLSKNQAKSRTIYQGIDRIDSSIGYHVDNVQPCCKLCNSMKGARTEKDFLNSVERIHINKVQRPEQRS